ncbi:MAG TPA: flagellar hook-basal body complex protein FliE [Ktedonobacterales bacterium]|nr:flagellar hook-basal body complex protein FliE [Ktedonobacterales bacterium]
MLPILPAGLGAYPIQATPITLDPVVDASGGAPAVGPGATVNQFGDLLGQAIDALNATQSQADAAATDLVTGKSTDLHTAMIDMQQAKVTLDLAVQVRDKAVDGYNDLMHTQM